MRTKTIRILALPLLAFLTMGASCPLIPQLEERIVELALLQSTEVDFISQGSLNVIDESRTIDLNNDFNLRQILADAGVDASDVKHVRLAGAAYVTTRQELGTARRIVDGNVTIQRAGETPVVLVSNFTEWVNDVTSYKAAPLDPAGIAKINEIMDDLLTELQGGAVANSLVSYRLTGQSDPAAEETDFAWRLRLDISVVGTIKVDVLD